MNDLERRVWWLLRAYPQAWQDERGEDLVATVLDMSRPVQRWPSIRVGVDLLTSGWSERAHEHRRSSGGWFAAGRRIAAVAAVILQVVVAGVWLRQWVAEGTVHMLPVLSGASAYVFVVALGGFIAATVAWLGGLARTARILSWVALAAWIVTVVVLQMWLSSIHGIGAAVLVAWTYLAALATWGLAKPPPATPVAVGTVTAAAGGAAVMAPLTWTPSSVGWLSHAPWGPAEPWWWIMPAWVAGSLLAILLARRDPRGVIAVSLLTPLIVLRHPMAYGADQLPIAGLALAVLLAAFVGPRAASSR